MADDQPETLIDDIAIEETSGGFEIRYSDRIADQHQDLVGASADWLEDQLGVINLGQIDYRILAADGVLTDQIKNGLRSWWAARLDGLTLR